MRDGPGAQIRADCGFTAGPERIASWEAEVQAQIDAQKVVTPQPAPLPWATEA